MRRFKLIRWSDETGISNTGHIASGVEFEEGMCVLRWRTERKSTAFYDNMDDLLAIHSHGLKTVCHWLDDPPVAWTRGGNDCGQDDMENVPFASVGGKDARPNLKAPDYITESYAAAEDYLHGYVCAAIDMYGLDWSTVPFSWKHVLDIKSGEGVEVTKKYLCPECGEKQVNYYTGKCEACEHTLDYAPAMREQSRP
jgi:hypothetical protein